MKLSTTLTSLTAVLPLIFTGLIFWVAPRTRRGVLFGISVPLAFPASTKGRYALAQYRTRVGFLTLAAVVTALPPVLRAVPWLVVVAVPGLFLGGVSFWLAGRRFVRSEAVAVPLERHATLEAAPPSAGWLAALAAALFPLLAAWLYVRAHLAQLPARFPTHWDIHGVANGWSGRSEASVSLPAVFGAAIILLMLGIGFFMRMAPTVDRRRALHVMLPTLAALGWSFSALFCALMLLPFRASSATTLLPVVMVAHLVCILGIVGWMLWRLMQTQGRETYDSTPDAGWRAGGLVYFNPADAAVMVPQRFGWGWTLNLGRPAAWLYIAVVFLFTLCLGALPFVLRHH